MILFLSLFFFYSSTVFSKSLFCSSVWDGALQTFEYNLKDKQAEGYEVREDEKYIVLISPEYEFVYVLVFDKKSNKFVSNMISFTRNDLGSEGTCKLIK
jgi:hypothetical protein